MGNPIDLTGQRFGRFFVIKRVQNNKDGRAMWLCRCDCGNERVVPGKSLRNGHTQSCGCLNKERISEASLIDHTEERFGMLTVLSRSDDYVAPNGKRHVTWRCRCDCGKETIVDACMLVTGRTKSCGCLVAESARSRFTTHGGRKDRLYKTFANMKNRCYNENSTDYMYYGARGIKLCDEWLNDYSAFKKWAYENGYDDKAKHGECTIDRIDVNGNYEPSNCRWVSMSVQSKNRRNVINKHNDFSPRKDHSGAEAEIG